MSTKVSTNSFHITSLLRYLRKTVFKTRKIKFVYHLIIRNIRLFGERCVQLFSPSRISETNGKTVSQSHFGYSKALQKNCEKRKPEAPN